MMLPPESNPPDTPGSQEPQIPSENAPAAAPAETTPAAPGESDPAAWATQRSDQEPVLAQQVVPCDYDSAINGSSQMSPADVPGNLPNQASGTISQQQLRAARARWWSPLAIAGLSLAIFVFTSAAMAMLALFIVHGKISLEVLRGPEPMQKVTESRLGLFIVIVIPQIALVIPCIVAAMRNELL